MSLCVTIAVGGQPRGKANHTTRGGVSYLSGATRDYLAKLQYAAQQEMAGRPATIQPVRIKVAATFEAAKSWSQKKRSAALLGHIRPCTKPDCDNILKIVGDACNGVIWVDDCQIVESRINKLYGEAPGLTIEVETIEPPALPAPPRVARTSIEDLFPPAGRVG